MFNKSKIDFNKIINEFISAYSIIVDPDKVVRIMQGRIMEFFDISSVSFFELKETGFICQEKNKEISSESELVHWLKTNSTWLYHGERAYDYVYRDEVIKSGIKFDYIFPLESHNELIGFCMIESGDLKKDVPEFLMTVFRLSAIALGNARRMIHEQRRLKHESINEKMSVVESIASMIAHEIKNPLTSIRSSIQFIMDSVPDEKLKNLSDSLIDEVDRVNDIAESVLTYARPKVLNFEKINLSELVNSVKLLYEQRLSELGINVELIDCSESLQIVADENALRQIMVNLMNNSLDAVVDADRKQIRISCEIIENNINVLWEDTGCGMSENVINNIFKPFLHCKKRWDGSWTGYLKESCRGYEYEFECNIQRRSWHKVQNWNEERAMSKNRILIVDDEEKIRLILRMLLEKEGYDVTDADSGSEAVNICRNKQFDVVFAGYEYAFA